MTRWLILLAALAAGLAQGAYHYTEEPDPGLYAVDVGQLPACDYVINSAAGWQQINSASYRVFCVAPGNYTSVGRINLTTSGTAQEKRWIRYHNPAIPDSLHPYHMTDGQRAIIRNLMFSGSSHWIVDRITVDMAGGSADIHAIFITGGSHNVINRINAYNFPAGVTIHNGANYNVVQNSTLHDNNRGYDAAAVQLHSWNYDGNHPVNNCQFNRVVNNEIWNVGDGFQSIGDINSNPEEDYRGTVVYNNDIYLTPNRYTNCAGVDSPTGLCAYAENALDIKSGSESADHPFIIAHNRMWGFRFPEPAATSMSDYGSVAVTHQRTRNVRWEGNVLWDAPQLLGGNHPEENLTLSGNLFHSPLPSTWSKWGETNTYGINVGFQTGPVSISNNVFSQMSGGQRRAVHIAAPLAGLANATYTNNVFINAEPSVSVTGTFAGTTAGNTYYASAVPAWDPTATSSATVPEEWGDWCTTIKRITAPTTQCFAKARYQTAGPPPPITTPSQFRILD